MHKLIHEIWELTDDGTILHCCCDAGPRGEKCRQSLGESARLLTTFKAGSHFEAMTFYNRYLGREKYTTVHDDDHEPYPAEWHHQQQAAGLIDSRKTTKGEKMSTITADPNMLSVLSQVKGVTEIRDANGNVVGTFTPKKTDEEIIKLFDLDKARETLAKERDQGRPLKEILDRLRAAEN